VAGEIRPVAVYMHKSTKVVYLFAATIFLSALLLFWIQLVMAKMLFAAARGNAGSVEYLHSAAFVKVKPE
jgi:hypothetical protein